MIEPDVTPLPSLMQAFTLSVTEERAIQIGTLATGGRRSYQPAKAGEFSGRAISGVITTGGETLLHRPDGTTVVEANYLISTSDHHVLRLIGTGYLTDQDAFQGTRMTVVFEVDEAGPYAWLSRRAFVAERPLRAGAYLIFEIC